MRHILIIIATALAYAFLRGWPEALHPLLRACLAVLILVLGLGLWNRRPTTTRAKARSLRPPTASDYLAMGLGVLAIECLLLFFLTVTPPKARSLAVAVEETLRPELVAARKAEAEAAAIAGGPRVGNWLWNSQGQRPLPSSLAARPSIKPEVFLRPGDSTTTRELLHRRPYVRAFALERYGASTWSSQPVPAETLAAGPDGRVTFPRFPAVSAPELSYTIYHGVHPGGQDVLTVLPGVRSVGLPRLRRLTSGVLKLDPPADPDSGYEYDAVSQPLAFDAHVASRPLTGVAPSTRAPEHLLALPEDDVLRGDLVKMAVLTQGPLEKRLAAIRRILRETCSYSLTIENEDNLDPLTNFLFHERRGHCEFFATAAALLARILGVPSRVAYGWTGGRWYEDQGLYMFRAKEAHAWTELYFDDVGWVVFDTTPADALDAASRSVAPPGETAPLGAEAFLDSGEDAGPSLGTWPWVALAAGAGLLPVAILLLRVRTRPPRATHPDALRLLPDPPGYLARFRRATARLGHPMPPARTLRQHIRHLSAEGLAPAFANDLLDYHYGTTYGDGAPDATRERQITRAIKGWASS